MPRRYQDYTPSAGLAQMAGGLGTGMAKAGQMANQYGKNVNDENYRQNQSKIQQDQFGKQLGFNKEKHANSQKLGYAQINAADGRHYSQLGQRRKEHDWNVNNPKHQMVNTADGVFAVNPYQPDTKNRLGAGVQPAGLYPNMATYKTDDGVFMYDKKNPTHAPIKLGGIAPKKMSPYDVARMNKMKQEQMAKLQSNYGGSWDEYTPDEQKWVSDQYEKTGLMPSNVDNWGWGRHYPKGYQAPAPTADQAAGQNAQLQQLQQILEQQNKLLQQ